MFKPNSKPWNQDKSVGPKTEFTPVQTSILIPILEKDELYRELALLTVGIDSMLRVSDLLQLRTRDVLDCFGKVKDQIVNRQQKTSRSVFPVLSEDAIFYLQKWIEQAQKQPNDFLFTSFRRGWTDRPLSDSAYRRIVKNWARSLELDTANYSTHSIRRSKPIDLREQGVPIEIISELLGHKDIRSTMHYLGINQRKAQETARKYNFFRPTNTVAVKTMEYRFNAQELEAFAKMVSKETLKQSSGELAIMIDKKIKELNNE